MDVTGAFLKIKDRSIFSLFPPASINDLLKTASVHFYESGTKIPKPEPGQSLCVLIDGQVSLVSPNSTSVESVVTSGRSIELRTFLKSSSWRFDWQVEKACTVLTLSKKEFDRALSMDETLGDYLDKVVVHSELQRLKNDMRLFGFTPSQIRSTIHRLKMTRGKSFETGASSGRLLGVVHEGTMHANIVLGDEEEKVVGEFSSGDYFVIDERRKIRFECPPETRLWMLDEEEWIRSVPKEKIRTFFALIDPIGSRMAAIQLDKGPETDAHSSPEAIEEEDTLEVKDFKPTEKVLGRLHRMKPVCVRQHDEMDCGAACMATIAKFYGKKISLPAFRSLIHVTRDGASMLSVKRAAEKVGIEAIGVMSGFEGMKNLQVPSIALMQYHFVVVFKATDQGVVVGDPGRGVTTLTTEEFKKEWSQNLLLFKPTEKFFKHPDSPVSFRKYVLLIKGFRLPLFEVFLASSMTFLFGLASPLFMQFIFDNVLVSSKRGVLHEFALIIISVHLLSSILEWARTRLLTHLTSRIDTRFSALFVRHTMKLPLNFFAVRRVGDITTRIAEIERVRDFFTGTTLNTVINFVSAIVYCGVLGLYSWKLLALLMATLPVLAGFIGYMIPKLLDNQRETYKALAQSHSLTFEQFNAFATLKSLHAAVAARWRWEASLLKTLTLRKALERLNAITGGTAEFFKESINLAMLLYAASLYMQHELTLGQVVAVSTLMASIVGPVISLITQWNQFSQVGVSLGRIDDIFTSAIEPERATGDAPPFKGEIEFANVTFQYGSELSPIVLDNISLKMNAGETIALVGRSGSGKSTLGYMVNLLYAPTRGKIVIDGKDATRIPLPHLRAQVAMVMQENSLFSGSIIENITMGDPHPSFKKAVDAAKAADAYGFVTQLPEGFSTVLGEGGEGLSGGQKQRVNIARALYRNPSILVMDEATSALDAVSEELIMSRLKSRARRGSTILIAHRLNTIMHADRIVVMDAGKIIEVGTHRELLDRQGDYYKLFRKQLNL